MKTKLQIVALQKPKGGWKVNCPDHGVQPLVSIPDPTPREIGGMVCKKCLKEKEQFQCSIWMMRQWLNECRITDPKKMVTDKDLKVWFKKYDY